MITEHTPMTIKAARVLCDQVSDDCKVDRDDNWNLYAEDFKDDAKAMLDACGAHDLLEALKLVYLTCDWHTDDGREAMEKASKAISKATGEK